MCDFSRDSPALFAGRGRPAKRSEVGRVRGSIRELDSRIEPLTPTLSPRKSGARECTTGAATTQSNPIAL
jgi:hypothetical protein